MHVSSYSWFQGPEVVIFHFLAFGRHCAKKCSSCEYQIHTFFEVFLVYQEVFLFRTNCCCNTLYLCVTKQVQNLYCLLVKGFHGSKERCFFVQCFAAVGTEGSRYVKCLIFNEGRRCRIPSRISSCFKGSSKTTGREAGCIRLTFYQFFAGELHDHLTVSYRVDEAVMLLCCETCHRLKPMCEMCCTVFYCPLFHGNCYGVCNIQFQMCIIINCFP